ncbi:hypothetical protein SI65_05743 [Aspergillus cristatus]|uniref:Uncharacterized protein n=1 Tax=Aspergillus cristatus TaxID=573508 RepID=A0A1E3BFG0_ASPCR|nr:hypothetical protein SI65_05743 [Aspergillus cristatus]
MITITVGLQDIQNKGPDLDEDSGSDKTDTFIRAQSGGFIQWHILSAGETIISSTHWDGCMDVFFALVTLKDRSRVMPLDLNKTQLCQLVRGLGSDLEQLQKLKRSQVADIWYGLEHAGFVECGCVKSSQVQEVIQDNLQGNCNTDVAQPTLSPPLALSLPMSDPKTSDPANDTLQFNFEHDSWTLWTDSMYACGDYPGSAFDTALGARTPDKSAVPMALNMIPLITSHPASGISLPAETTSTPGLHWSVSSYSTPSTTYVDSPHMGEQFLPGLGATMLNQAVKRKRRDSDQSMQSKSMAVKLNPTIFQLLQSCAFYKVDKPEEEHFQKALSILKAEVHLFMDPCGMLQPLLGGRDKNMLLSFHALGLPAVWRGKEGAVNYICLLDRHASQSCLHPVAERIAQVLLYFNYKELCKHPQKYLPPRSKPNVTSVLNCIVDAYHDDPCKSMPLQSHRNRISGHHVRGGRRWWDLAGTWGAGILLTGDALLMGIMCNDSFSILQTNALVTFVLNTRPGTIRIFRALEPVVKSLMFEQVTDDLMALFNDESGLLGQNGLTHAHAEDEAALACQQIENPWTEINANECAMAKMHEFVNVLTT